MDRNVNTRPGARRLGQGDCVRILRRLIRSAPKVLLSSDGSTDARSLAILIKELSDECSRNSELLQGCLSIVGLLLAMDPSMALRKDRQESTPLYYLTQHRAPLDLVLAMHYLNQSTSGAMNLHRDTPLDASRRRIGDVREHDVIVG